jgi:hypothetical protein
LRWSFLRFRCSLSTARFTGCGFNRSSDYLRFIPALMPLRAVSIATTIKTANRIRISPRTVYFSPRMAWRRFRNSGSWL